MIKFVTGKPGGGKSLRSMQLILDELLNGSRTIVTNLPLQLDNIQEYLISKGSEKNPYEFIVILRPEELHCKYGAYLDILRTFFLYRNADCSPLPRPDTGEELDFPQDTYGRLFVIDEIHKLWPAREFAKCDKLIFEYLAEHRHFSDDVVFITQALAQVDKQIRLLGQDFEVIRNRSKEKFSIFAGPQKFNRYVYLSAPTGGNQQSPMEKTSFTLDLTVAECYQTSAKGGKADKGQKAKGVPWRMIYVFGAFAVFGIWLVVFKGPGMLVRKSFSAADPAGDEQPLQSQASAIPFPEPDAGEPEVFVNALVVGTWISVWLSDGTRLDSRHHIFQTFGDGVIWRGRRYMLAKPWWVTEREAVNVRSPHMPAQQSSGLGGYFSR